MADRREQIERLRKRHRAEPGSKAFAPLADQLRRDGQVEEALSLLEDGLARHPSYVTAMVILGCTLLDTGRNDHARKVLARVLDLDPDNLVALGHLAQDACDQKIWLKARPWLEQLVALEPNQSQWVEMLDRVRAEAGNDWPAAVSAPDEPQGYATMTMVDIYLDQGYYGKALAALKLIQSQDPGRPDVKVRLAQVLAKLDQQCDPSASAENSEEKGNGRSPNLSRSQEKAALRSKDKEKFADWINNNRPDEGTQ